MHVSSLGALVAVPYFPASQSSHAVACPTANVPAGHARHAAALTAAGSEDAFPASHAKQALMLVDPVLALKKPEEQAVQVEEDVEPLSALNVPDGQAVQAGEPAGAYSPRRQVLQVEEAVAPIVADACHTHVRTKGHIHT